MHDLTLTGYRALAEFRFQIRRFLHFSEEQVRSLGLEPQQHQLLLTVKGLPPGTNATISELADRLQLRHHSVVELVDRMQRHGYVVRGTGKQDRRQVIVRLTSSGSNVLRKLSLAHHQELEKAGPALFLALRSIMKQTRAQGRNVA